MFAVWLTFKRRSYDQHGPGSKPALAVLLCPWERQFMALSSTLVVLESSCKLQSYLYLITSGQQYLGISKSGSG